MTKRTKRQYRIRNWCDYNKALISPGSLTLWIDTHSTDTWLDHDTPARRGRRRRYTDSAILCALQRREVYHLPLRATEGLVRSILHLMHVELPAAHYWTLSRRARRLTLSLPPAQRKIEHLVIDSSGLKVYGEGERQMRTHGKQKRRRWRKLHISMDAETHQLLAASITDKDLLDRHALAGLLAQTKGQVARVCADGAYDFEQCYRAIKGCGAVPLIPPRSDAVVRGRSPFEQPDENVRAVKKRGRKRWEKESGYHKRSLVETAFFRLKAIFSDRLRSRRMDTQTTEAIMRCLALNRMTSRGMPESYAI